MDSIRYFGLDKIADKRQRKIAKRVIKRHFNKGADCDELMIYYPLTERERQHNDNDDWDYWYEYGFLKGTDYTDDEVREILDDMRYVINSPYDCTGQAFTAWIKWHRNPSGLISFIHRVGLDL